MEFTIIECPNSYEKILRGGNVIRVIGRGRQLSPGHPAGNQQRENQLPILNFLTKNTNIPFSHCLQNGHIQYLGQYRFNNMNKKITQEGFQYFEFEFYRNSYTPV